MIAALVVPVMAQEGAAPSELNPRNNRDASGRGSVVFERTQIVFESEEPVNFPNAYRFADGTIWLYHNMGQHTLPEERGRSLWSKDNGKTWENPTIHVDNRSCVLPDGTIVAIPGWPAGERPESGSTYHFKVHRHQTPQSPAEVIETQVTLPFRISDHSFSRGGLYLYEMLALENGTVLASAYGNVEGERYRSYVIQSKDRGETWEYLSTISNDEPGEPVPGREGPCEPGWAITADGSILALMRTGDTMWQSRSRDNGATWEQLPPDTNYNPSCPRLFKMSNGVLVAVFGSYARQLKDSPQLMLLVDYDGTGEKWDSEFVIYKGPSSGYTSVVETEPGHLMFFYDESQFTDGVSYGWYPLNRIMALHIRIEKN